MLTNPESGVVCLPKEVLERVPDKKGETVFRLREHGHQYRHGLEGVVRRVLDSVSAAVHLDKPPRLF